MTGSCEHCRDRLWDLVYDLLEPDQDRSVRLHIKGCIPCQMVLQAVELQQQRIGAAARLAIDVPLFVAPGPEPEVLPFPTQPRRRVIAMAAAAAAMLLLTFGLPYGTYEYGMRSRTTALTEAQARLADARSEREQFQQQITAEQDELLYTFRGKHLRMAVLGPTGYQPGAASSHQVLVTDLNGRPADADVTARILAADERELLRTTQRTSGGTLVVSLPPNLDARGQPLRLEVTGVAAHSRMYLQESLPLQQSSFVTHLAVAKLLYQPGDIVFFRSVTLDRFALTPVKSPLELRYTLTDPAGRVIHEARGALADGGIGGGAVELPRHGLREGEYVLTVADSQARFAPQSRRLHVHRPVRLKKELTFDQPFYQPGDNVVATIRAHRLKGGDPVAERMVTATLFVDGEAITIERGQTDAQGMAKVRVPLPRQAFRALRLTVVINEPGSVEHLDRDIPIEKPGVVVEFFPEGGDLLAGVPNRVYVRARDRQGRPAAIQGRILDGDEREVAALQANGLGVFEITPVAGRAYRCSIEGGASHLLSPVRETGIALHVPAGVVEASQAIPVVVHAAGSPRNVIVAAFCRGRLVAQEVIPAFTGRREVRLVPPANLGGVVRLTVFEDEGDLRPAAERLVYRVPAERLRLTAESKREQTPAGEKVTLLLQSAQEDGRLGPAWLLVSAVDEESAGLTGRRAGPGVPAQFQLLADVRRPEDLEDADFLLEDRPEARAQLDLYLGTQGWRRFVDADVADNRAAALPPQAGQGLFTKLDSYAESWRQCEAELAPTLNALRARSQARDAELLAAQEQTHAAALAANVGLQVFQDRARTLLSWGITLVLAGLGVAGLLALLSAALRGWRDVQWTTRPYLAGGLAALLVACATLWGALQPRVSRPVGGGVAWGKLSREALDLPLPSQVLVAAQTPIRQQGAFAFTQARPATDAVSRSIQLESLLERRGIANGATDKPILASTPGKHVAQPASFPTGSVKPDQPPPKPLPPAPPRAIPETRPREYAYLANPVEKAGTELPDTVLWLPTLLTEDGRAVVDVVLPRRGATYQVLLHGHSATGRLGFTRLQLKASAPEAP